jgi:hypothetical protein
MIKRALPAVAAFLAVCFSLPAQEPRPSGQIQPAHFLMNQLDQRGAVVRHSAFGQAGIFGTLNNPYGGLSSLTLADGRPFAFPIAFAWMDAPPADVLPAFTAAELPQVSPVTTTLPRDPDSKAVDLLPNFDYVGGEVGVFYGRSTGNFKREVEQGYILGEVVNGNTHIIVGGSYEHSSGSVPRFIGPQKGQ